ncbi:hypothetical protein GCM10025734_25490 [Kitasatospora paranensis]
MRTGTPSAPARRTGGADGPALLLIAHGSRDPRHAATVDALVRQVRALRPGPTVATAYLDHCAPRIGQVAGRLGTAVAVPLLLNRAFHAKSDIPAALRAAGADLPLADVLGPSPLLLDALDRRLHESGLDTGSAAVRARTGVVLAAAGSSDPAADAATRALAADWARGRGWAGVEVAYASAAGPRVPEAVAALRAAGARRVAVSPTCWRPACCRTGSPRRPGPPTCWRPSWVPPRRSPPSSWSGTRRHATPSGLLPGAAPRCPPDPPAPALVRPAVSPAAPGRSGWRPRPPAAGGPPR